MEWVDMRFTDKTQNVFFFLSQSYLTRITNEKLIERVKFMFWQADDQDKMHCDFPNQLNNPPVFMETESHI